MTTTMPPTTASAPGEKHMRLARPADRELRFGRPVHFGRPTRPLEQPDHSRARIDLMCERTVASRAREGVVEVVPGLAERDDTEGREVGAAVLLCGRLAPEHVADGVHTPG